MIVLYWKGNGKGEETMLEQIVIPLLLYELLISLFPSFFPSLGALGSVTAGNLLAVPVLVFWVSGHGQNLSLSWKRADSFRKRILYLLAGGIAVSILLNNLMIIGGLFRLFPSVAEVQESIYAQALWLQILGTGIIIPIAEELVYRGILYRRLREYSGVRAAVLWSAVLFGVMHGNVVQGIYAGLMGVFLAWAYEICGSFLAPVMIHIAANMSSISGSYWMRQQEEFCQERSFYIITAIMAAVAVWSAVGIKNRR